jgi:L-asparaginase / beta-aspartyl-peptidase
VARRVMEELPHVFLVGEGAARFAAELGMPHEHLLTPEAEQTWRAGLEGRGMIEWHGVSEQVAKLLARGAAVTKDPEHVTGTVNFIAQDAQGRIASAVSTSGWAWKYPGRLGDSPIIGAGNYADSRYGAAGCTGWGELAMRACTARSVVLYLRQGMALEDACRSAFRDLGDLDADPAKLLMSMVAMDRNGNVCAVSTAEDRHFVYRREGMSAYERGVRLKLQVTSDK